MLSLHDKLEEEKPRFRLAVRLNDDRNVALLVVCLHPDQRYLIIYCSLITA